MKLQRMVLALLFIFLLTACGTNGSSPPSSSTTLQPTALHVLRPILKDYRIPSLDRIVQNTTAVQRLYAAAYKLPAAPSGIMHCPMDIGLVYQLNFLHDNASIQKMMLEATGCHFLFLAPHDVRVSNYAFQLLFSKTIGISSLVPRLMFQLKGSNRTP